MYLQGVRDLSNSERGVFAVLLLLIITLLLALGVADIDKWIDYTKWIATALIIGKTVTTAIGALVASRQPAVPEQPTLTNVVNVASPPNP